MKQIYFVNDKKNSYLDVLESEFAINSLPYDIIKNRAWGIFPSFMREYWFKKQLCQNKNDKFYFSFIHTDCADIYFHQGALNASAKQTIKSAKTVIVTSQQQRYNLLNLNLKNSENIFVIYPGFSHKMHDYDNLKSHYFSKTGLNINDKRRIIFFTATNFKLHGINEFLSIVKSIENEEFIAIIAGTNRQIETIKFTLAQHKLQDLFHLYKISPNKHEEEVEELLVISDIFVYPTSSSGFSPLVLKAMALRNAVFVPTSNSTTEILDHFATMSSPSDLTTVHKISALLSRNDLEYIKDANYQTSQNFTIEKNLEQIKNIILALEH